MLHQSVKTSSFDHTGSNDDVLNDGILYITSMVYTKNYRTSLHYTATANPLSFDHTGYSDLCITSMVYTKNYRISQHYTATANPLSFDHTGYSYLCITSMVYTKNYRISLHYTATANPLSFDHTGYSDLCITSMVYTKNCRISLHYTATAPIHITCKVLPPGATNGRPFRNRENEKKMEHIRSYCKQSEQKVTVKGPQHP